MSLYKCNNCPYFAGDWSWQCFSKWFCEFNSSMDSCIFFDEGFKANRAYITLEVSALIAALLLFEKLLAFKLQRDYGSPSGLYAFAILMTVLHSLATLLWFGFTEASFNEDCSKNDEITDGEVHLCAETGPAVALIALVMAVFTLAIFFLVFYRRTHDRIKVGIETGEFLRVSTRTWMYVVITLQIAGATLIGLSVYTDNWVKRHSKQIRFKGGLLECKDCHLEYEHLGWDCLSGFMCDIDSEVGYCLMYEDLKEAGRAVSSKQYIALAVTASVFIIVWVQGVAYIIQGREYGFASLNYVSSTQIYAGLACLFQLLAVTIWFGISKSAFNAECNNDLEDPTAIPALCSSVGPGLAIAAVIVIGVAAIVYSVAFYFRGMSYVKEVSLQINEDLNSSNVHLKVLGLETPRS
jgi:hypothetical protein